MTLSERDDIEHYLRHYASDQDIIDACFNDESVLEPLISAFEDNPKYRKLYNQYTLIEKFNK